MGNITNLIKEVARNNRIIETFAAKVIKINLEKKSLHSDLDAYTVDIMRSDGAIINNVRLKADIQNKEEGILLIPKKDSWVLASIIEGVETRAFISQYSEIERTVVRIKKDEKLYFEMETDASKCNILFKEKKDKSNDSDTKPEYNKRAQFEIDASTENSKITTAFYDKDGKEISKTVQTGTQQQTILSTVNGSNVKERVKCTLTSAGTPNLSIQFNDQDANEKQKVVIDETHTEITVKDGYKAEITKDNVTFMNNDLTFEMKDKFKIKAGGKDLLSQLNALIELLKPLTTNPMSIGSTPLTPDKYKKFDELKTNIGKILE
ncbi:hypothetical protein V3468_03325 [Flavobacterium oreochromis]|uniref:hypothetical protein n=1 Tax=Flavobacterium oreochromis TaxID=2906078 RepID=UPI00385ACC44